MDGRQQIVDEGRHQRLGFVVIDIFLEQRRADALADLAIARLRDSIDAGGSELPIDERRLTRARRAVEKAAGLLREPDDF